MWCFFTEEVDFVKCSNYLLRVKTCTSAKVYYIIHTLVFQFLYSAKNLQSHIHKNLVELKSVKFLVGNEIDHYVMPCTFFSFCNQVVYFHRAKESHLLEKKVSWCPHNFPFKDCIYGLVSYYTLNISYYESEQW